MPRENLKAARKDKGMTQQQVADHLGISLRYYQMLEAGKFTGKFEIWDERANIEKLMSAFSTEHRYIPECEGYVRSFRRKGRVFLRMEEPLSVQAARNRRKYAEAEAKVAKEYARKPNPYPGD